MTNEQKLTMQTIQSDCCFAPVEIKGGMTMHFECTRCCKDCDTVGHDVDDFMSLTKERDAWRACAEQLAAIVDYDADYRIQPNGKLHPDAIVMGEFERLKGDK